VQTEVSWEEVSPWPIINFWDLLQSVLHLWPLLNCFLNKKTVYLFVDKPFSISSSKDLNVFWNITI
jgi:hypothetical protein